MFKVFDKLLDRRKSKIVIDEKYRLNANIHFVKGKTFYEPYAVIKSENLNQLKKKKEIVVQLLQRGKTVVYAGIGTIEKIRTKNTKQRPIPANAKVEPISIFYRNNYYKITLNPVCSTRVVEKEKRNIECFIGNKKTLYIRPNLEYNLPPAEPFVNFDVYDENMEPIENIRAIVSFKILVERWMVPLIKDYNKVPIVHVEHKIPLSRVSINSPRIIPKIESKRKTL